MVATSTPPATWDLDIGVIYTHERSYMAPLLSSLARSGDGLRTRLILVDNASQDGVSPWTCMFRQTKVLRNDSRLGYAANLNRILAASTARYTLLLNTDMYFDHQEQCLSKMVKFMDQQPRCGISICRVYHPDGSYAHPARRFQTICSIAARRLGLSKLFASALSEYLYLNHSPYDTFDCDWVSGCFMFVRRKAMEQVELLDTGFRKYFEDVDLCARMTQAGWKAMFNGETYCYHSEQRASKRLLSVDAWLHFCSYLRWLGKWGLRPPRFPAVQPAYCQADVSHNFQTAPSQLVPS